ncbi:MAG TPA: lipase [Casimicrobiaceae bacterium]|nr:lipase [Casimicrobiaceae bacterium]
MARGSAAGMRKGALSALAALALLWHGSARADTEVYLLRGWFNVFSTGMDTIAGELRSKGIRAEAMGHLSWRSAVEKIVDEHASGATSRLVLVGHSQGANNAIDMARELEKHDIAVDLLITLVPFMQDPVPANVVRAIDYYQSPGWGSPLTADPGFKGEITNINIARDWEILHITIDKSTKVQAAVVAAIAGLPQ